MRGLLSDTTAAVIAEDPTQIRNRANRQRLNKISEDLLAQAIGVFKTMTPAQARAYRMRCLQWHGGELREGDEWGDKTGKVIAEFEGEKKLVRYWLNVNVNEDNWELVRFLEPRFVEKGEQPREFVPAEPDSSSDTWPDEKRKLYDFVTQHVSPENRHLVQLLNYEDIRERKAKRRARLAISVFDPSSGCP